MCSFLTEQVLQVLMQMGIPPKTAGQFIEMYRAMNEGTLRRRSRVPLQNTTPTSFERFVQDEFPPAYQGRRRPLRRGSDVDPDSEVVR